MKVNTSLFARLISTGLAATLFGSTVLIAACSTMEKTSTVQVTDYVDPFIGTANDGNNYPGAVVPWGLANVSPHNIDFKAGKAPTSYRFGNDYIYNFGHMQLAGVGCPATGSLPMKVTTGELSFDTAQTRTRYSHEVAEPGYYTVYLDTFDVTAEMTATQRSGISKFTVPSGQTNLIFDLAASQSEVKGGEVTLVSPTRIDGYQIEENFCSAGQKAKIYYSVEVGSTPKTHGLVGTNGVLDSSVSTVTSLNAGAYFTFDNQSSAALEVRVGISLVSAENARLNLETEQQQKSFVQIKDEAKHTWQQELSKLNVTGDTVDDKVKFYTAFYHALIMPQVMSDVNGEYPSNDRKSIKTAEGYTRYTTFSLWDTYRTLHPLLALTHPQQQLDMVKSMVEGSKESGWLPKWELLGTEAATMVGDPAVPVIVDSYGNG
jgi:predicted alpha-1,2-mannosidase